MIVGVLVPERVPAWAARAVDLVAELPGVEVVRLASPPNTGSGGMAERALAAYERADRRLFRPAPDALAPVEGRTYGEAPDPSRCDAVLNLTSDVFHPPSGVAPRLGVWAFDHGDGRRTTTGSPSFIAEMIERREGIATTLRRVDQGNEAKLYKSFGGISRRSLARNRNEHLWKAAAFPRRVLEHVARGGALEDAGPELCAPVAPTPDVSVGRAARFGFGLALAEGPGFVRDRGLAPQWRIGVRAASPGHPDPVTDRPVQELVPPEDRFYADPFLLERDGHTHLFFEELEFATWRGVIVVVELDDDGRAVGAPERVLERPHHLSYPSVWEEDGEVFMTAESAEAGLVELLRAADFPRGWEPIGRPLEGVTAYDPTVIRRDDGHWLWVTIGGDGIGSGDELHLFFADSLEGPWEPHPRNPVVSDARCARPAGLPFTVGSKLIRPAQVCVPEYGVDVVLREVEFDREAYREAAVGELGWAKQLGGVGCHTYNRGERLEAFDWCVRVRPPSSR